MAVCSAIYCSPETTATFMIMLAGNPGYPFFFASCVGSARI
jgi:hypothetical protein